MIFLILFAFLAGIITILSPCILPILPIILTSTIGGVQTGKSRPLGVVVGFVLSFTFFTLFLSTIVKLSGISADALRLFSVFVVAGFGISLLIPKVQLYTEWIFSKLASYMPNSQGKTGFTGGLIIGLSVGLLWTPCVGPILASVISLAITGTVTLHTLLITFAYALGTAIPMFFIIWGGQGALKKIPWLYAHLGQIQKIFGVLMILTALAIFFNLDRKFQTFVLDTFPKYGIGLTQLEDNELIRKELDKQSGDKKNETLSDPNFLNSKRNLAPDLVAGGEWFNSKPLALAELKGKVVLIDFWTYTCINCQRTLPYLREWNEKYKEKGLVIIGVHAPEFEFEKDPQNVQKAIEDFKLTYPIVQDNNFETWRAYNNRYWPAKYFIDKDGYLRYHHFGEGAYDESEEKIQELLKEAGAEDIPLEIENPTYQINSRTPELYLGYARIEALASPEKIVQNAFTSYSKPVNLQNNKFALQGEWALSDEYANPQKGAKLFLNFESKEVYLVMRPKNGGSPKVKVLLDGEVQSLGADNVNGTVTVDSDDLYKLINLNVSGRHMLELEFEDDNVELFAFTFG